ncbi:MAG TPA: hypothetical protein VIL42_06240 [Sphingomicrobium sp.]|jgi:hypothetical protein
MVARFALLAAAASMAGAAIAAEPVQPPRQPEQSGASTPRVVLASASDVRAEATPDETSTPKPRRIARVTSCRCGGAQPQPDQEQ